MSHYSAERKEVILKQLLPPHNRTVTEVSAHEGISTATLYNWRNKAKLEGVPVPGRSKSSEDWSGTRLDARNGVSSPVSWARPGCQNPGRS